MSGEPTLPPEAARCDYCRGYLNARCPATATHYRYTARPDGSARRTKVCEAHRYPKGQTADTESLWAVPNA